MQNLSMVIGALRVNNIHVVCLPTSFMFISFCFFVVSDCILSKELILSFSSCKVTKVKLQYNLIFLLRSIQSQLVKHSFTSQS